MFDLETIQRVMPRHMRGRVNQVLIDEINQRIADPDIREQVAENVLGYINILQEGRFKVENYLNAVQYCTHKLYGDGNLEAWIKVFPQKYARLVALGIPEKDIHSHAGAYAQGQLVNKILAQAMVPTSIINAHHFQEAINKQVDLMRNAKSERIQMEAANSLLNHLKPPETKKIELEVGVKESGALEELKVLTAQLAHQQKSLIESGVMTAKGAAQQGLLIEGSLDD